MKRFSFFILLLSLLLSAGFTAMTHSEEKDPRLVGHWRHTESRMSGDFSMASDTHVVLEVNGTYRYWSGGMAGGGSAGSFSSGSSGNVDTGAWKTANKIVYIKEAGDTQWQPYARYYVDHDSMLLKFNNGSKQLWYRR